MQFLKVARMTAYSLALLGLSTIYAQVDQTPIEIPEVSSKDAKLNANNDHGIWLVEDIKAKLSDKWVLLLHFEQRWGSNYRLFWYEENDADLLYDITKPIQNWFCLNPAGTFKSLAIGGGCAEVKLIQKNTKGKFHWTWITRPEIEAHLGLQWDGWDLMQRFRGEYQDHNNHHYKKHAIFRWRLILTSPWSFTCLKITPFLNNEFFFRNNTYHKTHPTGLVGGLFEDRLRFGLSSKGVGDRFSLDLWWQWRPLKQKPETHPRWFNTYQWGLTFGATF